MRIVIFLLVLVGVFGWYAKLRHDKPSGNKALQAVGGFLLCLIPFMWLIGVVMLFKYGNEVFGNDPLTIDVAASAGAEPDSFDPALLPPWRDGDGVRDAGL